MTRGAVRGRGIRGWLVLVAGLLALLGAAASAESARDPVMRFEGGLIEAMRTAGDGAPQRRYAALERMVDGSLDMDAIARATIGRHWEGLPVATRATLTRKLRDYAVSVLADRFVGHTSERFVPQDVSPMDTRHSRVRSRFINADGEATQLDYVVRMTADGQRIVNVYFDGVSGTDIQRGEFEAFLRDGGAASLEQRLDALIADLGGG